MPSSRPSYAFVDYVFATQGAFLLATGIYLLLDPVTATTAQSSIQGATVGVAHTLSVTCLSLSAFYFIAAYQKNRLAMISALPLRTLACCVFWGGGEEPRKVAIYEAVMGAAVGVGLLVERK